MNVSPGSRPCKDLYPKEPPTGSLGDDDDAHPTLFGIRSFQSELASRLAMPRKLDKYDTNGGVRV
jgi:hypothetical protein